jgi:hypothetical protein
MRERLCDRLSRGSGGNRDRESADRRHCRGRRLGGRSNGSPPSVAILNELLKSPRCKPTDDARLDLESGQVDARLVEALLALATDHEITISIIKTGHTLGATAPSGRENDHYFYRAADIIAVDGQPVADDACAPGLLGVGRILHALPPDIRPHRIYGPAGWHLALGYSAEDGFISDPFHDAIHDDHVHLGYARPTIPRSPST